MTNSNLYLLIYCGFWAFLFLFYQKKQKCFDVGSYIISSYLLYALASLYLYNHPLIYSGSFGELKLFPFIYLFILLYVGLLPVLRYSKLEIQNIQTPNLRLLNVIIFLFLAVSILQTPSTLSSMRDGLTRIMLDEGGSELYLEAHEADMVETNFFFRIVAIFYNTLSYVGIYLYFYYLTLRRKNKLILVLFPISMLVLILTPISQGLRTGAIMVILTIIGCYFMMKPFYSKQIRRIVSIIGLSLLIVVSSPIIFLTTSRFGESDDGTESFVMYYIGQGNINFDKYALDAGGIRYGDRTAGAFKQMLFMDTPKSIAERRNKYSHMKLDDGSFSTYVGDFVLDYGPSLTFALFLVFSLLVTSKIRIKNKTITFHTLLLVYFCMSVCAQGGMYLFNYSDKGNYRIIMFFLIYLLFKYNPPKSTGKQPILTYCKKE